MNWWTLIAGEAKYRFKRRATPEAQAARAQCCATCPLRQDFYEDELREAHPEIAAVFQSAPMSSWCGEPGQPAGMTCGCPVLAESGPGERVDVTIKGRSMRAVRKAELRNEHCPLWAGVSP